MCQEACFSPSAFGARTGTGHWIPQTRTILILSVGHYELRRFPELDLPSGRSPVRWG